VAYPPTHDEQRKSSTESVNKRQLCRWLSTSPSVRFPFFENTAPANRRLVTGKLDVRAAAARATRQLHYSKDAGQLALDLGLFINGLPIATFELKNRLPNRP